MKFSNEVFQLGWSVATVGTLVKVVALLVALAFVYINYRGASETGFVAVVMAAGQMITLALICIAALVLTVRFPERMGNFQDFMPGGWDKVLVAMGLTYVASRASR